MNLAPSPVLIQPCFPIFLLLVLISGTWLFPTLSYAELGRSADAFVEPTASDNFYEARVRFWSATQSSDLRGILVLLQGTDSDARGQVDNPFWRTFAQREQLGLLGVYFRGEGESYEDAAGGSGAALLRMIAQIATVADLTNVAHLPLWFVGHSSGAMFSYNFAGWSPAHVTAFAAIKTGPISVNPDPRLAAIPGLFIVGEHDEDVRVRAAAKAFAGGARPKAWALAVEPGTNHEWTSADNNLIGTYFHALLSLLASSGGITRPASTGGITRDLSTPFAMNSRGAFLPDTIWLPDATSANAWANFTKATQVAALTTRVTTTAPSRLLIAPTTFNLVPSPVSIPVAGQICGSVVVRIEQAHAVGCTFNTTDPRLTIEATASTDNSYRLNLLLQATGLPGGFHRSTISVVTHDQKNMCYEALLPVLTRVPSAAGMTPASLYAGVFKRGEVREQIVRVPFRNGHVPWKIRSIRSSNPAFATATAGETEEENTTIVCRFCAAEVLGNQSGQFDLVLADGSSSVNLTLPFLAFVSKQTISGQPSSNQHPTP